MGRSASSASRESVVRRTPRAQLSLFGVSGMTMRSTSLFVVLLICTIAQALASTDPKELSADSMSTPQTMNVQPKQLTGNAHEAAKSQIEVAKKTISVANTGAKQRVENAHATALEIRKLAAANQKPADPFAEEVEDDQTLQRDHELDEQTRGVKRQVSISREQEKDKQKKAARKIKEKYALKAKLKTESRAAGHKVKEVRTKCKLQMSSLAYAQSFQRVNKAETGKTGKRTMKTLKRAKRAESMVKERGLKFVKCKAEKAQAEAMKDTADYKLTANAKAAIQKPGAKLKKKKKKKKGKFDRTVQLTSVLVKLHSTPLYKEIDNELENTVSKISKRLVDSKKKDKYLTAAGVNNAKNPVTTGLGGQLKSANREVTEASNAYVQAKLAVVDKESMP